MNNDPRLGDMIVRSAAEENIARADVVIVGVPTDEGIIRNGGRSGAAQAPDEIRKYLNKLTPFFGKKPGLETLSIVDYGNVSGSTLEEIHAAARDLTRQLIAERKTVVALGGGHDVTYPLAAGFHSATNAAMSLLNVDAHLDVRPKKNDRHHSGSSFRLLIEEGHLQGDKFTEFGIQPFALSAEHYAWATGQGAAVISYNDVAGDPLPTFSRLAKNLHYLSFDIDSIRSADAPGCSAPSPIGFAAHEACEMVRIAGTAGVQMFDIVEVSPPYDLDGHTARLAARMVASFLCGITER
jgi:formimidoylglutamase